MTAAWAELRAETPAAPTPAAPDADALRAAIYTMRAAVPAFDSNPDLHALRRALADRIEADIAILDLMGGDPDLEEGSDAEPSLCGVGTHPGGSFRLWQGYPQEGGNYGDHPDDLERDDADDEPSLGSLGGNAPSLGMAQSAWACGTRDDREGDDADGPEGDDEREEENEHGTDLDAGEAGDDNGIGDRDGLVEQCPASVVGYSFELAA